MTKNHGTAVLSKKFHYKTKRCNYKTNSSGRVQTDITSKGLRDSEEARGEPQRFKFLYQEIGDTATNRAHLSTNTEQTLR